MLPALGGLPTAKGFDSYSTVAGGGDLRYLQ